MTKSLYDVLEVAPAASPEVIQAAYLGLRGKYANRDADSKSLEHLAAIELPGYATDVGSPQALPR